MPDAAPPILVSEDGAVAQLVLNRPRQGNSLSAGLVAALREALAAFGTRRDIKVIVISGAGGRIFSAGHDLNEFAGQADAAFLAADFAGIAALMQQVMAQPQIVIAKVEGVATAAGCELVAACDLALASSAARFGVPGVNIGFWCHTPQVPLSRSVGPKQAMMMLATGKLFPADHALKIGLVNSVHEPEDLDGAVAALCETIAAKATSVIRRGKASFRRQLELPVPAAYEFVRGEALDHVQRPDAQEGIAAFLEKRAPAWPEDV
ncbi:MAG: enoyl-CoA hydratase/isomerase family protein [Sphingomonadales bacterium]|nr:enoyl-CoA hydratase/isomerase family protein [Sphingomonadales bacterium]MDE2568807.1 enoyl-CoA hydratase/isomerase family protein [Sphingomonadales bacterium]